MCYVCTDNKGLWVLYRSSDNGSVKSRVVPLLSVKGDIPLKRDGGRKEIGIVASILLDLVINNMTKYQKIKRIARPTGISIVFLDYKATLTFDSIYRVHLRE